MQKKILDRPPRKKSKSTRLLRRNAVLASSLHNGGYCQSVFARSSSVLYCCSALSKEAVSVSTATRWVRVRVQFALTKAVGLRTRGWLQEGVEELGVRGWWEGIAILFQRQWGVLCFCFDPMVSVLGSTCFFPADEFFFLVGYHGEEASTQRSCKNVFLDKSN
mmetsp:Transcript_12372/g.22105  ORF Transcript_12372/g.22105 Transcript_12372/m.22105 type:complete len:163 (-) Transcript_12372:38-526(-)